MPYFEHTYILIIALLIWVIWIVFFREKMGYILPNPFVKKYLRTPISMYLLWIARLIGLIILFGMLANPFIDRFEKIHKVPNQKIVIILDISRSMLEEDITPNRLNEAKNTIHTFLTNQKNSQFAFIFFAGKAFVGSSFTTDISGIDSLISNLSPYTIKQNLPGLSWTAIWDALLLGTSLLSGSTESNKSIILFTDGQANIGIAPSLTLSDLTKADIKVFTVWIGKPWQGSTFLWTGSEEWSFLDETLLRSIAETTQGQYVNAASSEDFDILKTTLSNTFNAEKEEIELVRKDLSLYFFFGFIIYLILEATFRAFLWKKFKVL